MEKQKEGLTEMRGGREKRKNCTFLKMHAQNWMNV